MKTTSFLPPISLNNARRSVNAGIALHKSTMAKLLPPTTFPSLTSDVSQVTLPYHCHTTLTLSHYPNIVTLP